MVSLVQSRQRPLSEEHARFYAASVILGLEYMQQRNIMWRQIPTSLQHQPVMSCLLETCQLRFPYSFHSLIQDKAILKVSSNTACVGRVEAICFNR